MLLELASPILFTIVAAYTPGPNNFIASHSGFNFGFRVGYYTGTVSLMGYADVSYMRIDAVEDTTPTW